MNECVCGERERERAAAEQRKAISHTRTFTLSFGGDCVST